MSSNGTYSNSVNQSLTVSGGNTGISKIPRQYAVLHDATRQLRGPGSRNLGYVHLIFNSTPFHFSKDVLTVDDIINDWFSSNKNDLMQDAERKRK